MHMQLQSFLLQVIIILTDIAWSQWSMANILTLYLTGHFQHFKHS
jgi:hypothetical protein